MEDINIFNSAEFLFAKPYSQNFYVYTIDNLNELSLIDKNSLKNLLIKIKCYDFIKTNYLLDRNLPLFFDIKNKKLLEFQIISLKKQDVADILKNELSVKQENENEKSTYEIIFGKNSTFYKQNIYNKELNIWES